MTRSHNSNLTQGPFEPIHVPILNDNIVANRALSRQIAILATRLPRLNLISKAFSITSRKNPNRHELPFVHKEYHYGWSVVSRQCLTAPHVLTNGEGNDLHCDSEASASCSTMIGSWWPVACYHLANPVLLCSTKDRALIASAAGVGISCRDGKGWPDPS